MTAERPSIDGAEMAAAPPDVAATDPNGAPANAPVDTPSERDGAKPAGVPGSPSAGSVPLADTAVEAVDPWEVFASTPETPPGRLSRLGRAAARVLVHEYTLAVAGAVLMAVVMTWPTLRYPLHTIPQNVWDPTLQAWQMAWSGHILLTDPGQLWHSNTFFPERYTFAFSDSLLGYAPAGMLGTGPAIAVLRYNIIFVLAHALSFVGMYALARQLGTRPIGAVVAAMAFAYAPWRLAQEGHLHIISAGGIPLALAMLARGHGWSLRYGHRTDRRHAGWAFAGWLVAAWQISLGFGIGVPFAYVLAVVVVVAGLVVVIRRAAGRWPRRLPRPRRPIAWRLLVVDLVGGLIFTATGVLLALPYLRVGQLHPYALRSAEDVAAYSPPPQSLLIAPWESLVWGDAHARARDALSWAPETALLPGFALYALALAGLLFSVWKLWQRLALLAGAVLTAVLCLGTQFFGGRYTYLPLLDHLPGWNGIRTPGRLIIWTTLFLVLLAAGAVCEFVRRARLVAAERVPPWPGPWLRLAMVLPLVLVTAESLNRTPHPIVPQQPEAMRLVDGPLLVLPTAEAGDQHVMLWSTSRFQQVANGSSGLQPQRQAELRKISEAFPDATSVQYLRSVGIRTVVLLRTRVDGTPWQRAAETPVDNLGIQRQDLADAVVFRL
jgi:hypothetical protein